MTQTTTCNTCTNDERRPYRVYDERGKVITGCVDACHTDHLIGESARWHNRPEAKQIRKQLKSFGH